MKTAHLLFGLLAAAPLALTADQPPASPRPGPVETGSETTPYVLTIPPSFPQPDLPADNPLTEEGVALGRLLFIDPRLSANNSQSCTSCHHPMGSFTERQPVSIGTEGQVGTRNAMPLFNLAWRSSFFWDGRAASLREQVVRPIQSPIEMHESLARVVAKLRFAWVNPRHQARAASLEMGQPLRRFDSEPQSIENTALRYSAFFARAFGTPEITADRIARALEQFLLTQVSYDSKYDRVQEGRATFTQEEQRGFELFRTEYDPQRMQFGADCFHCHGGPLFQSQTFANNGLDAHPRDLGRFLVTGKPGDKGKFAVPSLRNVASTAPYMHDGRFQTLEEVIEHYCTGMKRSPTLDPNLAKHPDGGLPLSEADKRSLVAFLKTLTEERFAARAAGRP